ncbi:UNVERIFIED_ORG: hypothetical protein J2W85_006630 [Ensifer adhaerens]|nr:hypothetical protein [Ensifer adhaerens]
MGDAVDIMLHGNASSIRTFFRKITREHRCEGLTQCCACNLKLPHKISGGGMHSKIEILRDSLQDLADTVDNSTNEERPGSSVFGWNAPSYSPRSFSRRLRRLANKIDVASIDDFPQGQVQEIDHLIQTLAALKANTLQYLFNGNGAQAMPAVQSTIDYVSASLDDLLGWRPMPSQNMPGNLARRLQRTRADLENLTPDMDELHKRLTLINESYEAAETLPTTLQELRNARSELTGISTSSADALARIKANTTNAQLQANAATGHAKDAEASAKQASEAHRITTSIGLAASFEKRATSLEDSLSWWVKALAAALVLAMGIGAWRLNALNTALSSATVDPTKLWIQVVLSVLSLGAPIWFAWMATKQIGQRFRLAEDYAYKASVAKAYEGYRREAVRLDPQLEKALFASALSRLDEQPIRFVESATHGSPIHELSSSSAVKDSVSKALDVVSAFKPKPRTKTAAPEGNE